MTLRVVVDTNVFVNALLSPQGVPSQLFHSWELHYFDLLVAEESLAELTRVLQYPKIRKRLRVPDTALAEYVQLLREKALLVIPQTRVQAVAADLSDNLYLEIALSGEADYLVTGDQHLLQLQEYQGISILTPAAFLAQLAALSATE